MGYVFVYGRGVPLRAPWLCYTNVYNNEEKSVRLIGRVFAFYLINTFVTMRARNFASEYGNILNGACLFSYQRISQYVMLCVLVSE